MVSSGVTYQETDIVLDGLVLPMLTMVVNEVVGMVTRGATRLADPAGVITDHMTYQE